MTAPSRLEPAHVRLALVLSLGSIATLLDTTIVSVALDRLGREFDAPVSTVSWVTTAYLLALTAVLPLTGWAAPRFGARRMWLLSLGAFLAGSVLCGLAWSAGSLIAFRVLQGLGGGMLLPLVRIVLAAEADLASLGRLMSVVVIPTQLAPVVGPVLGGFVIGAFDWRWAFLVNVPICLAALALSWRAVHGDPVAEPPALDRLGLALLTPGLAALVLGLTEYGATGDPFDPATAAGLLAGVLLLAGYCRHALRTPNPPIFDLRLFRDRSFRACAGLVFVFGGSLFGAMLLLPLYYQQVHGATPLQAGLLLAPQGIGAVLGTLVVGRVLDRTGAIRAVMLAGLALATLGTMPFAVGVGSDAVLIAALVVRGLGLTAALLPSITATYATLPRSDYPAATTGTRALQQVGGSFGTAVLAVVLARTGSFPVAFWVTIAITAVAAVAALSLPRPGQPASASAGARKAANVVRRRSRNPRDS